MKKIIFVLWATLIFASAYAQGVSKISLTQSGNITAIAFEPEKNLMLNVSTDGHIINFGYDVFKERGVDNYFEKLEKYAGNIEYYTDKDDEAFRGKVKYIGRTLLTYYASFEGQEFAGKLKTVGINLIQYYNNSENEVQRGKIKSIGTDMITWYSSFENEAYRGKIKSFGSTQFSYYSSFDDKAYQGNIKSINGSSFNYYSSVDRTELRGRMSSGSPTLFFSGIKYFVKQ